MGKTLVIVESPAKAKTIEKYLGKEYQVLASYGHVRDLEPKEGAVDPSHDFAMKYQLIERNQKHVETIIKALRYADGLILATDPDREGEAIAWHLYELLQQGKKLENKTMERVVFHEITKAAIQDAVAHPRGLSFDLVNAQQARRALDYLVGFNLSPLLWRKIRRGLSAGRVQSPALRLIVERELEIEKFISEEYWSVKAQLTSNEQEFFARLTHYQGNKVEQFTVNNEAQAVAIEKDLLEKAQGHLVVTEIDKKQRRRNPAAPFTTSTLQQEASRKLGFTAKRTMMVAQQLYEGIDIGDGAEGLITYMRTDSVALAQDAVNEIREYIQKKYGAVDVPDEPRIYKTKSKNAQEAHEAIRPTSIHRSPNEVKRYLKDEQFKLYDLIWKRTLASQMIHATFDTVAVDLRCGQDNFFRANGSVITSPGFIKVYQEGVDDSKGEDGDDVILPPLSVGDQIPLRGIETKQHFTEPPPRYSEATLVKALEEFGIGRPSTYASIISTLQQREYAILDKKRFFPTDVGRVVNRFLTEHFTKYVDYSFTANLEDELDAVSRGEKQWIPLLREFWDPFKQQVSTVDGNVQRKDVTQEVMDEACPQCGAPLSIRLGRKGRFIGCTAYPECDYTRNVDTGEAAKEPEVIEDRQCPDCQSNLIIREGRYGKFIGCSNYPKCRHIEPLEKPADTQVECPSCHKGMIYQRKSRRGKLFYSCSRYPDCQYALWNEPINESCPKCQWPILTIKETKKHGKQKLCPQDACGYSVDIEEETASDDDGAH
jgi:DNA topoisomerase-1